MAFNPSDPFFETTISNLIDQRLGQSQLAILVRQLQGLVKPPTYTVATRPTNAVAGQIVFVSDGGAGAVFQGWNGSAWVNLG